MTPSQVEKNFLIQKCDILGLQTDLTCFLAYAFNNMVFLLQSTAILNVGGKHVNWQAQFCHWEGMF